MSLTAPAGIGSFAAVGGASRSWANGPAKSILGSIRHALVAGVQDLAFHWVQDSTGNQTDELPYTFANLVGAAFPERNVRQRFWNTTSQTWNWWTESQASTLGARYREFSHAGSNNSGVLWPSAELGSFTGPDFTIIAKVSVPTVTATNYSICAQYQTTGNKRKFWLAFSSATKLVCRVSEDGTAEQVFTETNAWTAQAGTDQWIKVVFDADNGAGASACTFYTGNADGSVWTQRSTHAGTVIATLYDTTDVPFEVGAIRGSDSSPGQISPYVGNIYGVWVHDDTAVAFVNPVLTGAARTNELSGRGGNVLGGGPELQSWISAASGETYAYFTDATRFPKIHPRIGTAGTLFVCLGHNERDYGYALWAKLDAYLTQYRARCAVGNICFIGQNSRPVTSATPSTSAEKLAKASFDQVQNVNFDTAAWCAKNNIGYVDLHTPFFNHPLDSIYINTDGIHPNPAGSEVRAALLFDQLMRS